MEMMLVSTIWRDPPKKGQVLLGTHSTTAQGINPTLSPLHRWAAESADSLPFAQDSATAIAGPEAAGRQPPPHCTQSVDLVLKGIHRTMQRRTQYAYVDGSDLDDVAVAIERELVALVASSGWVASRPIAVNQKSVRAGSRPDDLPDWNLGVNLTLAEPGLEPPDWFADIERVVARLAHLHSKERLDVLEGGVAKVADSFEQFTSMMNDPSWYVEALLTEGVALLAERGLVKREDQFFAIAPHPALTGKILWDHVMAMDARVWHSICAQVLDRPR